MSVRLSGLSGGGWRVALAVFVCLWLAGCERSPELPIQGDLQARWDDYRGRWVFINYWAEWCLPCRKEMPELNEFAERFAGRAVVLGVNFDQPPEAQLKRSIEALQVHFPVLLSDPAGRLPHQRPTVLPTTVVYDPEGQLQAVLVGPQTLASLRMWLEASASDSPRHP